LLRFLSNATIETEGLSTISMVMHATISDGDVSIVTRLLSTETPKELESCVREPEEVGRVRSAIDCN
jgi:hypothetical protein